MKDRVERHAIFFNRAFVTVKDVGSPNNEIGVLDSYVDASKFSVLI